MRTESQSLGAQQGSEDVVRETSFSVEGKVNHTETMTDTSEVEDRSTCNVEKSVSIPLGVDEKANNGGIPSEKFECGRQYNKGQLKGNGKQGMRIRKCDP